MNSSFSKVESLCDSCSSQVTRAPSGVLQLLQTGTTLSPAARMGPRRCGDWTLTAGLRRHAGSSLDTKVCEEEEVRSRWGVVRCVVRHAWAGSVESVALNPSASRLATACTDGTVRVWATEDGSLLQELAQHVGCATQSWSLPSSRFLFAGEPIAGFLMHLPPRPVYAVRYSKEEDGRRIFSGGHDMSVVVWEAATGAPDIRRVPLRLPSRNHSLISLSLSAGQVIQRMSRIHQSYVLDLSLSPDDVLLATASGDRTVGVWRGLPPSLAEKTGRSCAYWGSRFLQWVGEMVTRYAENRRG